MNQKNPLIYRFSQFISLLLGARFFVLIFYVFALYVSTFFFFNQEESLKEFVFDIKVHGIIFCAVLSIAAGGIINQFYDVEKDKVEKPFRSQLQSFLKQKYFLYTYLILNTISLSIAGLLSWRIFVFFLIYQFVMWFYSHKITKIAIINNLTYVALTLYPFYGMLVYYQHFSLKLFWMAAFLFLALWIIDIMKDILTMRSDKLFGYDTIPLRFGIYTTTVFLTSLLVIAAAVACIIVKIVPIINFVVIYFSLSALVMVLSLIPVINFRIRRIFWLMGLLRVWLFIGVLFLLLNGIYEKI